MRLLAWLHRWTGGLIGLLLALLGATGSLLVWKEEYLGWTLGGADAAPLSGAPQYAAVTRTMLESASATPRNIIFSHDGFALNSLSDIAGGGFYADQSGQFITGWTSSWDRPETFLFDLYHHLLIGESGELVTGIAGLIGIAFVVTGLILWWRSRKTFRLRLWPARMTRSAIVRQHRDLGAVMAPLLFLTMLTGVMMTLRPVAHLILSPLSSAKEMQAATAPPPVKGGRADRIDWDEIYRTAEQRFPQAELRIANLPRQPGDLLTLRMKQPAEWLPNGRTLLWFDAATARLVDARDANDHPVGLKAFNLAYPLHAAKVGGWVYQILQTLTGLALTLLGSLAVWSFWFRGRQGQIGNTSISASVLQAACCETQSPRVH